VSRGKIVVDGNIKRKGSQEKEMAKKRRKDIDRYQIRKRLKRRCQPSFRAVQRAAKSKRCQGPGSRENGDRKG